MKIRYLVLLLVFWIVNIYASANLYIDGVPVVDSSTTTGSAVSSVNGLTGDVILSTANISETTDKNYIADVDKVHLGNLSGVNTGDETKASIESKLTGTVTTHDHEGVYEHILPDVPADPSNKFLNGNRNWVEIALGSGGYASNLYFTDTVSGVVPTYKQLSYALPTGTIVKSIVLSNSESLIDSYIFDLPLGVSIIDAGSWLATMYSYSSSSVGTTQLKIEVYKRSTAGVETLLFTKYTSDIDNTTGMYTKTESVQPSFTIDSGDRLVAKVYGKTTSSASQTISYIIGNGTASYVNTPLALRHNQLRSIEQAGAGVVSGHISDSTQTIAGAKTFSDATTINNTLTVNGDIIQSGNSYETHAEQLLVEKDAITVRDGAITGLAAGQVSGITAENVNGTNNGILGIDSSGALIAGIVGSTKLYAAREDLPTNGKVPIWNSTTMRFETSNSPTTISGYGITDGAIQGTAYNNLENNVKIVQGVPQGGKMYLGVSTQTGAIKIKLPKAKSNAMFKFRVRINGYSASGKQSNTEYIVKGYNYANGFGCDANSTASCQVTTIKDNSSLSAPIFYFCNSSTEDYVLIGEIIDTHVHKSVVIDDVEIHFIGNADDWSKDWAISLVTTLETLTSTFKVAVTPSLNATHLNGVQEDTEATANTLAKRDSSGFITPSQTLYNPYNITAIYGKNYVAPAGGGQKITLPTAIENKVIEIYKSNNSYNAFLGITGTDLIYDVSANDITPQLTVANGFTKFKYAKFVAMKTILNTGLDGVVKWVLVEFKTINFVEDIINNVFIFLKKITVKSTDTNALDVQNATGTSVFTVDTQNQVVTGSAVSTLATANTIAKRDANGAVTNSQYKLSALNTAPASATATGTLGEIRIDANYIYVCVATNSWKRTALTTW